MTAQLIGRTTEANKLKILYQSPKAEFLAIYGRRRVGKTYLIRQYFKNQKDAIFFNSTGERNASLKEQILNFTQKIGEIFYSGLTPKEGKSWKETFQLLTSAINNTPKKKKIVLFFDELPWMATTNSKLLQALDYYWNQYWSDNPRIKLIICGSSASWIINKIINNKGGLHNRVTGKIALEPFKLGEVEQYLLNKKIRYNHKQLTNIFMVTGGIPYYLDFLQKGLTAVENIEAIAFTKNAELLLEFDNLFSALFKDAETYIEILKIIHQHRYGITHTYLTKKLSTLKNGGNITRKLNNLKDTGFIMSFKPFQHNKKNKYYRLVDEYTAFYFKWIEPIRDSLQETSLQPGYWQAMQETASWHSWSGYAFENICYKHLPEIRKKLNIPPTAIAHTWRYSPKTNSQNSGAQIDLLFDRRDDAIHICEIKYTKKTFVINKQTAKDILNKQQVFRTQSRTKKQLLTSLISASGIQENLYSDDLIASTATLEDLFN